MMYLRATRPHHTIIVSLQPLIRRTRCLARSSNLITITFRTIVWTTLPLLGTTWAKKLISLHLPMELSLLKMAAGSESKVIFKAKVRETRIQLCQDRAALSSQAESRTREACSRLRILQLIALGSVLLVPEVSSTKRKLTQSSPLPKPIWPNSNNRCSQLTSPPVVVTSATSSRPVFINRVLGRTKNGLWWTLWISSRSRTANLRWKHRTMEVAHRTQARVRSHARGLEQTSVAARYNSGKTYQVCRNRTSLHNRASNQTKPYSKDAGTTQKRTNRTRVHRNIPSTAQSSSMIPRATWRRSRHWMSLLSTGLLWIARKR